MPRLWPDPRDSEPDHPIWLWVVAGTFIAYAIANIYRYIAA